MPEIAFELVHFKKGAYVITEGPDELDRFYIIKNGKVERQAEKFLTNAKGARKNEHLGVGDFFGVISCMARRPRIENVLALEDTSLIVIRRDNFGTLIQNNTAIAMKIIRFFSRQLRYYDLILAALISKSAVREGENPEHLYALGNHYLKNRNPPLAAYAFVRYIQHYPKGKFVEDASKKVQQVDPKLVKLAPRRDDHSLLFEDGQTVFLESEPGHELYVIQDGKVKISKVYGDREVLLDVLKSGDIFGEMAIIENRPRNANAVASGALKLMAINKNNFEFVVKTYPDIATRIIVMLSDRIWLIYRQIANMFISDPEIKIYDAFYTQLLKNRVPVTRGISYTFDFGTEDLLKFTGLTGQAARQVLQSIVENGKAIQFDRDGKFVCSNLQHIEQKLNLIKRNMQIQQNMQQMDNKEILDGIK
jgi:CRP/FNR family transcriptional regulator